MKIAICLLTYNRSELTYRTLKSFHQYNKHLSCKLYHADDGSRDRDNGNLARRYGFKTIYTAPKAKFGPAHALRAMWQFAVYAGCTHILHLEQDWQWERGLPLDIESDCIRLYGDKKQRDGDRKTGGNILGTNEPIVWKDIDGKPGWQKGIAHWGGPPSLTRADYLLAAALRSKGHRIGSIALELNRIETVRPLKNIVWHIG